MKKVILSISILIFLQLAVTSQKISIAPEKNNFIYSSIDNPVNIVVENSSCKSIIVKTDNGSISGNNGDFIMHPTKKGVANITIYKSTNGKLKEIGKKYFRVKQVPDPIASLGYFRQGKIQKKYLGNFQFFIAIVENFDFDVHFKVDSFTVNFYKADKLLYKSMFNNGNEFSADINAAFKQTTIGETIVFDKIYATGPDKISRNIESVSYLIY